jgi:hypothetical protein
MPSHIPGHEHFISAVSRDGEYLAVRFVSGHDASAESGAFELRINSALGLEPVAQFLGEARERDDYLYTFERDGKVVISNEGGDEVEIDAEAVHCKLDGLNREELGSALVISRSWYDQERQAHRQTSQRMQQMCELAREQLRRIEAKMRNHDGSSPAGVLYSQHAQFLERLLRAAEA